MAAPWLLMPATAVQAAPAPATRAVPTPFGAGSWAELQREADARQRPMLVVFTATWCSVCPDVVAGLHRDARRRRRQVPLLVVLTDVAPDEWDAHAQAGSHLGHADRLMAFDGPQAALRHSVDPRWRGMVPQVAWLRPGRAPEMVAGAPAADVLQRWLGGTAR